MDLNRLQQILDRAPSMRITVIGDLMLDEFVWGKVGRISPEAPVPVVEVTGESFYPGGAANVARNLREFIEHVAVIGMLGKDRSGQQLRALLTAQNIDTSNAVEDETFHTIVKTRIIALHQQVVRVDREKIVTPSPEQIAKVVAAIRKTIQKTDAIIFEDYGKGFVTTELVSVIALFTLGLVCGATPIEAAEIANHGSAVVVSKLGTATVARDELVASFREDSEHD